MDLTPSAPGEKPPTYSPGAQPPPQIGYQPPQYPQYPQYPQPVTQQPGPVHQTTNTTVVLAQQQMVIQQSQRNWSTGLCGCCEDCGSCCMGLFCPFCLLIDVSTRMGEGCCFPCCCPNPLLGLRIKLRVERNITGTLMDDYCAVACCQICVLCQLARELNHPA